MHHERTEEYRRKAEECRARAAKAPDHLTRAEWIMMAQGLSQVTFRREDSEDRFSLFLAPFTELNGQATDVQHLVMMGAGPKGTHVLLGTFSAGPAGSNQGATTEPKVEEEKEVVDGKVVDGRGQLRSILNCSFKGCAPSVIGCLATGPEWAPCFCLACAGSVITCSLTELFNF
jgi:hypothetical protein